MLIALDYDKTYSADKSLWQAFIELAQYAGHEVEIVTVRHEELDWNSDFSELQSMGIGLNFTDGWAKRKFMENAGKQVDIWIDDRPETVANNSTWSPNSPELAVWRANNKANGT